MPLPRWLAVINRRLINPGAVEKGKWPVLTHVGRKTGHVYRTPLDAYEIEDGFLFTINYGARADWPRNVLTAGGASLAKDGEIYELTEPQLVPVDVGYTMLDPDAKTPPRLVGVEHCLVTKVAGATRSASDQTDRSRSSS